ncbi:WYL domain-containing protein [Pseudoalteromonas maricaloris]|uniref:WYL domain-containing protein n=1 Tax=Pseudoalteromonas maricaloris TaxID=184924 RepID=A0A8I2H5Q1_9GAMM|nr:WYL domain-containing protein [Pseudoalteromonas maricaloris]NLR20671.1 WYL domain-containing protein [Pseudoalteromonas maricaloris]WOX29845.1 WYL domain-containing protein [Pseudoalteromonas maricaloris]
MNLEKLNYAQRERLAFIDFCLQFVGQIARADLINHFKTGLASCSRDLTLYKKLAPNNLELRHEDKQYYRTNEFRPIFTHNSEAVLISLCRGFGDGLSNGSQPSNHCFDATRLIHPDSNVIATLMRAINSKKAVRCDYVSLSSGESSREIVPHAIANNGQRWHVRAFDRKSKEFRDFVCTRLQNVSEIVQAVSDNQLAANDMSWNNILNVELSVHPSIKYKKAIELDYNMLEGVLRLEVREALLGYLMRQWNVDCTKDASLVGDEYHLWLSNINELENVASMTISPGYKNFKI